MSAVSTSVMSWSLFASGWSRSTTCMTECWRVLCCKPTSRFLRCWMKLFIISCWKIAGWKPTCTWSHDTDRTSAGMCQREYAIDLFLVYFNQTLRINAIAFWDKFWGQIIIQFVRIMNRCTTTVLWGCALGKRKGVHSPVIHMIPRSCLLYIYLDLINSAKNWSFKWNLN